MKYFATIGDCLCHEDDTDQPVCPDGMIEMNAPYPNDGYYIATADGDWVEQVESKQDKIKRLLLVIDKAAGNARARFGTDTPFIEPEYELSYQDAVAFINAGYTGDCPDTVQSHVDAFGVDAKEAADTIKQMGDAWYDVIRAVRKIRLAGKQAVETAPDDADFDGIAAAYIQQLDGLQPAK